MKTILPSAARSTHPVDEALADEASRPVDVTKAVNFDGINISAEYITEKTAHLPEEQRDLVRWLFSYARENQMTWDEVSKLSTLSKNVLYKVWHDKYRDPEGNRIGLDNLCVTLARCKALAQERAAQHRRFFVLTGTATKIHKICDEARVMQTIAFIIGESQVGKTYALEEYAHLNNSGRTIFVRVPAASGVQELMKAIAAACGISSKIPFNKLKAKIKKFLDHTKLLILDEAHLLFETYQRTSVLRCLETLREIHDECGCGMVICATEVFTKEIESGEFAPMLKQFKRRSTYTLKLPLTPPRADWLAIAAGMGLEEPVGYAELTARQIVATDGLGKLCKFLRKGEQMAGKRKQTFTWDHFTRAYDLIQKLSKPTEEAA